MARTRARLRASLALYVLIQWSWLGRSFYDTRYDPDDTPHRLLVLTATVGAGAITIGVMRVPGGRSATARTPATTITIAIRR